MVVYILTENIMVGMSGGVDSSVAALLLKNMGYSVLGATLFLCGNNDEKNAADALSVCEKLGIEHCTFDLKSEFSDLVVADFINEYKKGNTPNPCIVCNRCIKFGKMLELATQNGCEKIATGHYARIEKTADGRYLLLKAKDESKDQSYVLYMLTQNELSRVVLPLGDLSKPQIREIALQNGLVCADRPDSQDICFVPDGDYAEFIEEKEMKKYPEGYYVDINGNILGKHKGVIRYTLGQRKGLGIALGKPQFVIEKNAVENLVVLGDEELLFKDTVKVKDVNFIPFDKLEGEMRVTAKLRYRHSAEPAVIFMSGENEVTIKFDKPQRAPSAGQAAVFYDGDIVVGGGTII